MPTAPYDVIETVLNAARVRLNDAIQALGGDILTDAQPFTLPFVNNAWRVMQNMLASLGVQRLKRQTVLMNAPPVAGADPINNVTIDWAGANDGVTPFFLPVLPQDLIFPLKLWERQTGTTDPFIEMDQLDNGLPTVRKQQWNLSWEWKDDNLVLQGAVVATDIRVRYLAYLPDFTSLTAGGPPPAGLGPNQPVLIMRCVDAFANYLCAEVAASRGDLDAKAFEAAGDKACMILAGRDPLEASLVIKRSEYGKMKDARTPGAQGSPAAPGGAQ
jgi:hypothetical protein